MNENKEITYQEDKLLIDGKEATIEEAESTLKKEILDFESSIKNFLLSNLNLKRSDIEQLSDTTIKTRMDIANNEINLFDFGEYFRTGNIIKKGISLVDEILSKLSSKKRNKVQKKLYKEEKSIFGDNINIDEINIDEIDVDKFIDMFSYELVSRLVYLEFKKQFHSDLKIDKKKISIQWDFKKEFKVNIEIDNINIYFEIHRNDGSFDDINEEYIASGFKIGLLTLQDSSDDYLKYGNNFRTAQTLENVITKEIRFLKTYIKSEIKYLEDSIFSANKKLNLAYLFKEYFFPFMDKKQKNKLELIINKSEKILTESSNKKILTESELDNNNIEDNNEISDLINWDEIEDSVKKYLNEFFKTTLDNLSFDKEKQKDKKIFKLQLSGQKVDISIDNKERVFVSSINSIGVGKNDIKNLEILGNNLENKLYKASLNAYKPLLIRQTENILSNIKGKKSKIIAKEIEVSIKNLINDICDYKIDINKNTDYISDIVFDILDNLIYFDYKSSESIVILIDKILKIVYSQSFSHFSFLKLNNIEFNLSNDLIKLNNDGEDLVIIIEEIKKKFQRILKAGKLITEITKYIDMLNDQTDKNDIELIEIKIKKIADDLSEDSYLGFTSRKILGLINISESSKDDLFKYNLEKITEQLFTLIGIKED
jgi:hypothetical protein